MVREMITEGNPCFPPPSSHHATCLGGMLGMRFGPHLLHAVCDPTHSLQARPFLRLLPNLHPLQSLVTVLDHQRKLILLFGRAYQQDNSEVLCKTELSARVGNVPASYSGEPGSNLVPENGYSRVSSGFL